MNVRHIEVTVNLSSLARLDEVIGKLADIQKRYPDVRIHVRVS